MKLYCYRTPFILVVIVAFILTGCIKEIIQPPPPGKVLKKSVIQFLRADDQSLSTIDNPSYVAVKPSPGDDIVTVGFINFIDYDSSSTVLSVNLRADLAPVPPGVERLPLNSFSFNSTHSVTPPTLKVPIRIVLDETKLDYTKNYTVAFTADTIPGNVIVDTTANGILLNLSIRNRWDGIYSLTGHTFRKSDPIKTGSFTPTQMALITQGDSSIMFERLQPWADDTEIGIGNPTFSLQKNNKVIVTSSGGAYNTPGYDSRYDPATSTFYISFTWGQGPAERMATDTLTFLGER